MLSPNTTMVISIICACMRVEYDDTQSSAQVFAIIGWNWSLMMNQHHSWLHMGPTFGDHSIVFNTIIAGDCEIFG